jgi:D-alanyl-D-alanine carboxypeptidase
MLSTMLFQLLPYDGGVVEQLAVATDHVDRTALAVEETLADHVPHLPEAANVSFAPVRMDPTSVGVMTTAVSALVLDRATMTPLFEKNISEPRSIGSITKLMTAHVFLKASPNLDASVMLESQDMRLGGTQHLSSKDTFFVRDFLKASLVGSDNTATAALARLSGMTEGDFVARMNEEAAALGMQRTTFVDVTGLSQDNRSSVSDLARMLDRVLQSETIRVITQQSVVTITGSSGALYVVESTDDLLRSFLNQPPYAIVGGKTGYLPEAGYCLGTIFSEDGGHEIIVVVLGSETDQSRFQDVKSLAAWAYKVYDWL